MKTDTSAQWPDPAKREYPRNQWYVAFLSEIAEGNPSRIALGTPVEGYRAESSETVALFDRRQNARS